jgi:hypothetical protein
MNTKVDKVWVCYQEYHNKFPIIVFGESEVETSQTPSVRWLGSGIWLPSWRRLFNIFDK